MNEEKKKNDYYKFVELAPLIISICKKHGIKGTFSVDFDTFSTLNLNIKSGSIDFGGTYCINVYQGDFADNKKALAFLNEVIPAMNIGNHDNSDAMTDYRDVGWYISVNIGNYDKAYILNN